MLLKRLFLLLLVVCALCVLADCQNDDIDRRDIHRIVLKPEKSKKHKKRTKGPKTKPFRPNQQIGTISSSGLEDNFFEPTAHASTTGYHHKNRQRHNYPNHHDEYHDLINPKPPRQEDAHVFNYPEEDSQYHETTGAGSSHHQSYVPYHQNSDWNPIPSTQLTQNYRQYYHGQQSDATATDSNAVINVSTTKRSKRKKKPRRKPVPITTSTPFASMLPAKTTTTTTTSTTTLRPVFYQHHSYQTPQTHPFISHTHTQSAKYVKPPQLNNTPQQHHYVNYNHNNKSHIKYEVSATSVRPRFQQIAQSVQQPAYQTIHLPQEIKTKPSNLGTTYEVFEQAKDYNKQIKQTNFRGTLVPQPIYPKLYPFLPTVSTYAMMQKTSIPKQLDFGKRQVGFSNFTKL